MDTTSFVDAAKELRRWDTLDDRREVARLLSHLHPADRWRFVRLCCAWTTARGGSRPVLTFGEVDRERVRLAVLGDEQADRGITAAAYGFIMTLSQTWGLSLATVAGRLTEVVRGRCTIRELEKLCGSSASSQTIS